jgi:hypothetical protein
MFKNFLTKKIIILLCSTFLISIAMGWLSIWFPKVFLEIISIEAFTTSNLVEGIISIGLMIGILGTKFETPPLKFLIFYNFLSYGTILLLGISPNIFLIVNGVNGAILGNFWNMFGNSLVAQNVENDVRAKFDNRRSFISQIGFVAGIGISYFFMIGVDHIFFTWFIIFIIFDLGVFLKLFAIKFKILVYKRP